MNLQKVQELISIALHNTDADRQYMAARDLSEELIKYYNTTVQEEQQPLLIQCYDVFFNHLSSQYRDIQGNSIKCLQTLAPKLRTYETTHLIPKLIDLSLKQDLSDARENYQICLQEIVDKIPTSVTFIPTLAENLVKQLVMIKQQVKNAAKGQLVHQQIQLCVQLQVEILRLLQSIILKWPQLITIQNGGIIGILIDNIVNQNEISIVKSSSQCLGMLSLCLNKQSLNELVEKQILNMLQVQSYDNKGFHRTLYINQALQYISKQSGSRFEINSIDVIIKIFKKTVKDHDEGVVDTDLYNQYSDLLEILLTIITNILPNLNTRQYDEELINVVSKLVEYDPYNSSIEVQDEYQEDYYYQDDQDTTWRVRRSAILLLQELLKVQPQLFKIIISKLFGQDEIILNRLNEKVLEIRAQILQFLIQLVQSSSITQNNDNLMELEVTLIRQRSVDQSISLELLIHKLLDKIKAIYDSQSEQQQIKSDSNRLLQQIAQHFRSQIHDSSECFQKVSIIGLQVINGSNQNYTIEQKIASIQSLKLLSKINNYHQFHIGIFINIYQQVLAITNEKNSRLAIEAHHVLDNILLSQRQYFQEQYSNFERLYALFKNQLLERVQVDALDKDLKIAILGSISNILKSYPALVDQKDCLLLSKVAQKRLQSEFASNIRLLIDNILNIQPIIEIRQDSILDYLYNSKKASFELIQKFKSLDADNYDYQIQLLISILEKTKIQLPENYIIDAIKYGCQNSRPKPEIEQFFTLVNQYDLVVRSLFKLNVSKDEIVIAGLILSGAIKSMPNPQEAINDLIKTISDQRAIKLSALRFLSRTYEIQQIDTIIQLIQQKDDAEAAAFVLGSGAKNIGFLQKLILQTPQQFFYYLALKEHLEVYKIFDSLAVLAEFLLQQIKKLDKERAISIVVGEILGLLLQNNFDQVNKIIFIALADPNPSVKLSAAISLKYSLKWAANVGYVVNLLVVETDLQILIAAVKALTQISNVIRIPNIFPGLSRVLQRFEERELDFGNFKEKRDDAKDLRSLSFDLLEINADKQYVDYETVIKEVFHKFDEDKYEETRLPRLRIIQKISQIKPELIYGHIQGLSVTFSQILKQANSYIVNKDQNIDKEVEKIKVIVQIIDNLTQQPQMLKLQQELSSGIRELIKK
ncbi:hypothetical protein pb186bvf_013671 [Paramecium bursaria]